jgi:hypothetical protein
MISFFAAGRLCEASDFQITAADASAFARHGQAWRAGQYID